MQYTFNIGAGASQTFDIVGKFFKLLTATGLVRVQIDRGYRMDLLPGRGWRGIPFHRVNVLDLSGLPNAGTFLAGDFEVIDDRISGDVSILDAINATCQIYNPALTVALGFTATQVIAPAANVNGIIVRHVSTNVVAGAGGTADLRLYGMPAAPASLVPTGVPAIMLGFSNSNAAGAQDVRADFSMRRRLPPGWGIYQATSNAVAAPTAGGVNFSAEIL